MVTSLASWLLLNLESGRETNINFQQHSMGSFSASSFMLNLLEHEVQQIDQKLGTGYHKFGMPTGICYT